MGGERKPRQKGRRELSGRTIVREGGHPTSSPPPAAGAAAGAVTFDRPSNGKPEGRIGQAYEWFLELPVRLLIAVMWLAGAAIIGLGGVAFYLLWSLLWRVAGA